MHSNIIKLKFDDTLNRALEIMNENKINGAPVTNEDGELTGMIVKADIYRFLMEEGHYDTCPVDWVMTKEVITASTNENIMDVAKKIRQNNIIAIPIVDNNLLVGIVSIEDIMDYIIEKYI